MKSVSRASFLKTAGAAAGAAAISVSPALGAVEPELVEMTPTGPIVREPVIAILRDARLGEVTVMVGTSERTYQDRKLASSLLKAAGRSDRSGKGGVA